MLFTMINFNNRISWIEASNPVEAMKKYESDQSYLAKSGDKVCIFYSDAIRVIADFFVVGKKRDEKVEKTVSP